MILDEHERAAMQVLLKERYNHFLNVRKWKVEPLEHKIRKHKKRLTQTALQIHVLERLLSPELFDPTGKPLPKAAEPKPDPIPERSCSDPKHCVCPTQADKARCEHSYEEMPS